MNSPLEDGPERRSLDVRQIPLQGVHLIEASAGTGKTYTITSLVLRLLVEEERPIESILAVTFTNAATAELKGRVYERIEEARRVFLGLSQADGDPVLEHLVARPDRERALGLLNVASQNVDRAGIFTIHGFAARMLQDHAFESGSREGTELVGDERAIVQDVVTDFWSSRIAILSTRVFEQIGGTWFYRSLVRVGLAAAGAADVPLVDLEEPDDLDGQIAQLKSAFEIAQKAFAESGPELFDLLLNSTSLNRNKYRAASVRADYVGYRAYFNGNEATIGHPPTDRWTQTKVDSSLKKNQLPVQHPLLPLLEELQEAHSRTETTARRIADQLRAELCHRVGEKIRREHERAGTQSFDGLLTDLSAALRDETQGPRLAQEIRRLLPVAMIDEFQDTDPIQYEIFSRIYVADGEIAEEGALYLIGDPKQSIYAFRGADVQTYLAAAKQASGGVWTLKTSYRASPSLVRAQNALFQEPRDAFCVPGISYQEVQARPGAQDELLDSSSQPLPGIQLLYSTSSEEGQALRLTAQEVARFLAASHTIEGRRVTPEDIAVLTRTNRQAQDVQALLRQLGIPAVMHGDRSVFESSEAMELRRVLQALAEPGHRVLSRTALATRLLGLSAIDLARVEEDHEQLELWTARLRDWGQLWRSRGIAHAFEALSSATDLPARTLSDRDGERRMTNFRHLLELLHDAQLREHLGVAGLLRYFEGAISDPGSFAMAAEARQLRLESDAQAVTLTTAHKSKGLEYNIVFLPSLALSDRSWSDEAFRYFDQEVKASRFEMRHKDSRGDSEEIHTLEGRQESLRLAYVALTRAKHHVVALTSPSKSFSALHYLLHERDSGDPGGIEPLIARLKKLAPDLRHDESRRLEGKSEGAVAFSLARDEAGPHFQPDRAQEPLMKPSAVRELSERERTNSFSSMTRGAHVGLSRAAREGRDVDEVEVFDEAAVGGLFADELGEERCVLADFPRGAVPGDALHAFFENAPFAEGTGEQRQSVVLKELTRRGFEGEHVEPAARALEDVLATPFEGHLAKRLILLGELSAADRVAEMEFSFPVGQGDQRLNAARLAEALGYRPLPLHAPEEQRGGEVVDGVLSQRYLHALSELPFQAYAGFLRGFMDLVFVWEGRLYGLDYKSNFLGETYDAYTEAAMRQAMEEHHYLLQALLYAVAIHRYGKARIPNYSYDEHFGGMHYLFVRGMHPKHSGSGVFSYRPSFETLDRLSQAFDVPQDSEVSR